MAVQAAFLSKEAGGVPVKLLWSREEDVRRDFYRPAARTRIRVALGEDGFPIGMDVTAASPSINLRRFPAFIKDGKDPGALSGFLDSPYPLDHHRFRYAIVENGVPVGYWRSVGHSQNVFFREAMINELAERANMDGLAYRRRWLAEDPRTMALFDALGELSGYSGAPEPGTSKGFAFNSSHGSLCAHVIHISTDGAEEFRVKRIDCVVDPGVAVNPDGVIAQVESQALDGLSAALFGKIHIKGGGAADSNFDTVRMLRMAEAPEIRIRVLEWDGASPGGMGEPALPSIAPALTDAIYQATGRRIRSLPVVDHGLELASA
ncbi:MAG: molybdopterin-dependent oxidoreductase [Alphaproteobacteria bacterium]|nr:molybdopterin-dependent oxidoreductase [Alphaproteobacteria bacterium]